MTMATGDLKNNLRKLKLELRLISYPEAVAWDQINIGLTEPLLPILHYLLADFSCELSGYLCSKGYEFYGKSDLRFIEVVYKILISEFNQKPMLTKQQFFTIGFTEIKVIFLTKIIYLCRTKAEYIVGKLKRKSKPLKFSKTKDSNFNDSLTVDFRIEKNDIDKPTNSQRQKFLEDKSLEKTDDSVKIIDVLDVTTDIDENTIANEIASHPFEKSALVEIRPISGTKLERHGKDVLDVTEIEDDEGEVSCQIIAEESPPIVKITKHLPELKLVANSEPSNKNVYKTTSACQNCTNRENEVIDMKSRISDLEKKFFELMQMNSELSAKVILLEKKVNFLEATPKPVEDVKSKESVRSKVESDDVMASQDGDSFTHVDDDKRKLYSPLKYSDDEIIIKDFKPLTMKDVKEAQQQKCDNSKNKENVEQPDDSCFEIMSPFDTKTSEKIHNVQKRFQYAERLLSLQKK